MTDKIKVPPATVDDRKAAALLVQLAKVDPGAAHDMLLPVVIAARIWADQQFGKKDESDEG